jgi:hypothetical protein
MQPQLRICSIHHRIEVLPGVWKLDKFLTQSSSNNYEIKEVECPTCIHTARELFKKQFPKLYATAVPASRKSA